MDRYGGVILEDMSLLAEGEDEFRAQLKASLEHWEQSGGRSVQIQFRPPKCHLMNVAAEQGFYFHHAHKSGNYVLMCKWLDKTVADRLPAYADHYVGVGGIVINSKEEVLMIQERRAKAKLWKFPGGYVDSGETLRAGVEREVREETGVQAKFEGVLALREQLDYKYGAADFYFVCVLTPIDETINIEDTQEVTIAKWIPLESITPDNEEVKLFPNAMEFAGLIKQWLKNREHLTQMTGKDNTNDTFSIDSLLQNHTLRHRSQDGFDSRANRPRVWNFYMPHNLDQKTHLNKL